MNYEKDIKIDETALDVEWLGQTELAISYGVYWQDCDFELSNKREELAIFKAELIETINADPETYLGEGVKPTVGNLDSCIIQNKDYQALTKELRELEHKLAVALIVKNEIANTRKVALQNLVTLHGQNYFAGPTMPRNISQESTKRKEQESSNASISKKLKRTK